MRTTFLLLALGTLGACSGMKTLNEHSLRRELDGVVAEMRLPAEEFSMAGPNLSTRREMELTTETVSYSVFISGKKGATPRVTLSLGRDNGLLGGAGNRIVINANGRCTLLEKGDCAWLSQDEWRSVHRAAIDFANRHFKEKNFFSMA